MQRTFTIAFPVEVDLRLNLMLAARAAGHAAPEEWVRELVYERLGRLTTPLPVSVPRAKARELDILCLVRDSPRTVTELCALIGSNRANIDNYVRGMVARHMLKTDKLVRAPTRPARAYAITEKGRAILDAEDARVKEVEENNRRALGNFKIKARKVEPHIDLPMELKGTPEGAYLTALATYGTGSAADKTAEYEETLGTVVMGSDTWEGATARLLENAKAVLTGGVTGGVTGGGS